MWAKNHDQSRLLSLNSNVIFRKTNKDNNRVSIRRTIHLYEEINLNEMIPDAEYADVDIVSDNRSSQVVPRTDHDSDGYLILQGQGNDEHVYQGSEDSQGYLRPVPESRVNSPEDQRHDTEGYLKPIPSKHDAIESQYLTRPLSGATASPYSTPYDHVSLWQKALQLRMSKRW